MEKYKNLIKQDLIEPVRGLIENGTFKFTNSGKLESEYRMHAETPWIHVRQGNMNCATWNRVWFSFYNIIPSYCQSCWKVVVRPTTLKELFMLYEIQIGLDKTSKCGIEKRYSVGALYGGYFYNSSKGEGLRCKKEVEEIIHEKIGPHVKVFLKRACTEYEHKFGDSRKWEVSRNQIALEARLENLFVDMPQRHTQGDELKRHIMANWIRFAFAQGDQTAKEFSDTPLYPEYITYEE